MEIRFTEPQLVLFKRAHPETNLNGLSEITFEFDRDGNPIAWRRSAAGRAPLFRRQPSSDRLILVSTGDMPLAAEALGVVPQKGDWIRLGIDPIRNCDRSTIESVIVATILKFFLDPSANLESIIGGHRHVPRVKETVNVSPKQQSIPHFV